MQPSPRIEGGQIEPNHLSGAAGQAQIIYDMRSGSAQEIRQYEQPQNEDKGGEGAFQLHDLNAGGLMGGPGSERGGGGSGNTFMNQ